MGLPRNLFVKAAGDDELAHSWVTAPRMIDFGLRKANARGLYRIFSPAVYRFYRSNSGPPLITDSPFATSATMPYQPSTTFADGTWYLSMSYFDGILDSGFLPIGPSGQTYLQMVISGGAAVPALPSQPVNAHLVALPGGIIQIAALYFPVADKANAANTWAIAYTVDGTTPANGSPTVTAKMSGGTMPILAYNLPAQTNGTVVKVQLQTYNGTSYSAPITVLSITVDTVGPSASLGISSWPGPLAEDA